MEHNFEVCLIWLKKRFSAYIRRILIFLRNKKSLLVVCPFVTHMPNIISNGPRNHHNPERDTVAAEQQQQSSSSHYCFSIQRYFLMIVKFLFLVKFGETCFLGVFQCQESDSFGIFEKKCFFSNFADQISKSQKNLTFLKLKVQFRKSYRVILQSEIFL